MTIIGIFFVQIKATLFKKNLLFSQNSKKNQLILLKSRGEMLTFIFGDFFYVVHF